MNWDALGALAELLGAIAVIATLVYLAAQVRENTKSLKGFSVDSTLNAGMNMTQSLADDPELSTLFGQGMENWDTLSEEERMRIIYLLFRYFKCLESMHYQFTVGILDESLWIGWRNQLAEYAQTKAGKVYLRDRKHWYSPEFIEMMESLAPARQHVSTGTLSTKVSG